MESRGELRELLARLQADTTASQEFRDRYRGSWDALDALAWRIDPAVPGPSGTTNPLAQVRELEVLVHSRPAGPEDEARRVEATVRLQALLAEKQREDAALDEAIAWRAAPSMIPEHNAIVTVAPNAPAADGTGGRVMTDGWGAWRTPAAWAVGVAGVAIAVGLLFAAVNPESCTARDGCRVELSPTSAPTASPSPTKFPTVAEQQAAALDSVWNAYMSDFPTAVRPTVGPVQMVGQTEVGKTMVDCMHAAGFPEVQLVADGGIMYGTGSAGQEEARALAMYTCRLQYPSDPLSVFDLQQTQQEEAEEGKLGSQPIVRGSARLILGGEGYRVFAYRLADPGSAGTQPLVCAELVVDKSHLRNGGCTTIEDFRQSGLRQLSGVIWGPDGGPWLTTAPG